MGAENSNNTNWSDPITAVLGMGYDQATMGQQNEQTEHFLDIQHQNNMAMMQQQFENQTGLNVQGHNLQFQMWLKTNYPAQVEQMKKAGLNPALMYKGAGPGGTTGSQSGGSAAMGSAGLGMAAKAPGFQLYGAQAELMKAQRKNLDEDTKKKGGEIGLLAEQRAQINAATKGIITENEIKGLQRELEQMDVDYHKNNYIAPAEYSTLKSIKSGFGDIAEAFTFLISADEEDWKEVLGWNKLLDEQTAEEIEKLANRLDKMGYHDAATKQRARAINKKGGIKINNKSKSQDILNQ